MKRLLIPLILLLPVLAAPLRAEENWPQFRGPTGRGHTADTDVPVKWTPDKIAWKTDLKGEGESSPVNWGDKLFVTSANAEGTERTLHCLGLADGKILWEKTVACAAPEAFHKMNSRATPTCATDGEIVVAFFGPGGLHAFDLDGKAKWSRDLGTFPGSWGVGASPVLSGNLVIQNCDAEGESSLIALDKSSGEVVWRTDREAKPKGGWSSPVLVEQGGKKELVLNGEFGVNAYDPETGKDLWFCKAFNGRGTPVPDYADGLLYVVNGKSGDYYAVEPGGSGDVTESKMKWHTKRKAGRDLPSPAAVDGYLIVTDMSGMTGCFDAKSGELLWNEKLPVKNEFAASPLVANGLVYIQTVFGGETLVIKPGKTLEIVAQNSLGGKPDEIFRSTLAPIGGRLYSRSLSTVYCIAP
ncbi:MAG: PQQ-binding-like beta-propeller repeat protein [Verrucomicrobiae bacterium]|nr:PQQ-binding-like beta-propeller repeat protein [Verrucomicrobiae bacterium]MCP5538564.1 PQQ-binding-like beta-propeller repeat protein [Akkermansiaceae bacterium]MCP5551774.1 PQQ-binding-like beta-propeller repeat protein [Akkermansiaceae bacterium]